MDKSYWDTYYRDKKAIQEPSPFARYVLENYLKPSQSLIELGCGNARDSIFFAQNGIIVHALDQCDLHDSYQHPAFTFSIGDFTKLQDSVDRYDNIYSRFTLHSINATEENSTLDWCDRNLKAGGRLFIEARGKLNELYGRGEVVKGQPDTFIYEDHHRRFIDLEELKQKLTTRGFTIISAEEKAGFAPFRDTDYVFMRVIAEKNHES